MAKKRTTKAAPTRACDHPRDQRKVIGGGLHRCAVCGAIRGVDSVWRIDGKVVAS